VATAAAVALAFGLHTAFFDRSIPTVVDPESPSLADRLDRANRNAAQLEHLNFGTRTLFLSFNDSISLTAMQNTLDSVSDTGNIVVESVYVLGNDNAVDMISPAAARTNQVSSIIGAKVYAPVTLIGGLRRQPEVALVEVASDVVNEETFVPLAAATRPERNPEPPSDANEPTVETILNFNIPGVIRAEFIDDNRFAAITADSAMLCEIYRDEDSDELQIRVLSDFDLDGEVVFSFFATQGNKRLAVMRVRSEDSNSIYLMGGDNFAVKKIADSDEALTVLAVTNNSVYYAVNRSVIFRYDTRLGISSEIVSYDDSVTFERNGDLSCFVINLGEAEPVRARVYNARLEQLTESDEVSPMLVFYRNSTNVLTDGENFYSTTLVPIENPDDVIRFATPCNSSELYSVTEITEQSVRILLR
jgi:hypothetical protein